jgi:hypothetical protein
MDEQHMEYEKFYGEQKIKLRNKRQVFLLSNGDVFFYWRPAKERDGYGVRCGRNGKAGSFC